MRACAEQALRNMMDMYIYFLFMYVSQSNLVLPVSLSGLITHTCIRETKTPVTKTSLWSSVRPSRVFVRALCSSVAVSPTHLGL